MQTLVFLYYSSVDNIAAGYHSIAITDVMSCVVGLEVEEKSAEDTYISKK